LADDLSKLDRESLLKMAQPPRELPAWKEFSKRGLVQFCRYVGLVLFLIGGVGANAAFWHDDLHTAVRDILCLAFGLFVYAAAALSLAESKDERTQRQIQALTELLNREAGK